jgi:FkbM family methyltransferase
MYQQFHGEEQCGACVDQTLRSYFPNYDYKGVFLDIGAYEPINISNSYHFEKNGWDVYCFEANTQLIPGLKALRENVYNYAIYNEDKDQVTFNVVHGSWGGGSLTAGVSAVDLDPRYLKEFSHGIKSIEKINIPQKTLNTVIEKELFINHIDILQIDVEGGELNVLKGLDIIKYKPKVILIEDIYNDRELHNYLVSFNYKMDKHISYNKYYVPI